MKQDRQSIWNRRYSESNQDVSAVEVLRRNDHLLSGSGSALDLACGLGGNARHLALRGYHVDAWDYARQALELLEQDAKRLQIKINTQLRDVTKHPPTPNSYDVIAVSYFLERSLNQSIIAALNPGGLLFYQTFIKEKCDDVGPTRSEFLLERNELLHMFAPLRVVVYREEGQIGQCDKGFRNCAMLIAQRTE